MGRDGEGEALEERREKVLGGGRLPRFEWDSLGFCQTLSNNEFRSLGDKMSPFATTDASYDDVSDGDNSTGTICAFLPTATSWGRSGRILVTTRMFLALVGLGDWNIASPPNGLAAAGGDEKKAPAPLVLDASIDRGVAIFVNLPFWRKE